MSPIDITFATPTHPELRWSDSFEGLEEEESEKLVNNLRVALAAFLAELTDRRKPGTDRKLENYKQKLQETAKQFAQTPNGRGGIWGGGTGLGQGWISFVGVFVLKLEAILGATRDLFLNAKESLSSAMELSRDKPLTLLPFLVSFS